VIVRRCQLEFRCCGKNGRAASQVRSSEKSKRYCHDTIPSIGVRCVECNPKWRTLDLTRVTAWPGIAVVRSQQRSGSARSTQ
jgi:hypothetical protein